MSFRIRDDKTGEILFETDNIIDLMDKLEEYEFVHDRLVKGVSARISEYGKGQKYGRS
tara:strand:- start:1093 stop:1266 length:174 start_codon:yes stop_codon:yes gene_type:complete